MQVRLSSYDLSSSPHYVFDNYYTFNEDSSTHDTAEFITEFPSASGAIPYFSGVTFSQVYWQDTLGNSLGLNSAYSTGDFELTASGIYNCVKVSNLTNNGLQTNWISNSSCPY